MKMCCFGKPKFLVSKMVDFKNRLSIYTRMGVVHVEWERFYDIDIYPPRFLHSLSMFIYRHVTTKNVVLTLWLLKQAAQTSFYRGSLDWGLAPGRRGEGLLMGAFLIDCLV